MSKLSSLVGKPKTYTIGGVELEIKPRSMSDLDVIMQLETEPGIAMKELVKRTLKDAVPDATDEEIAKVGLEHFKAISDAIVEVNGLSDDKGSK